MTDITFETVAKTPEETMTTSGKAALITYGLMSYLVGCGALVAFILSLGGIVPLGGWITLTDNTAVAVLINVLLTGVFGLQHSVMARPAFKQAFNGWFGKPGERSTYLWSTGVAIVVMLALWQPVPGELWSASSTPALIIMWSLFLLGWGYLFAATFAINHFDLFGLRQVWFAINDRPYVPPAFKENWMYRYSRHPIMLGALVGMWCLPQMTGTALVLAITMTAYIFIGVMYEERDLVAAFGERYLAYRQRVGMFFSIGRRG